MMRSGPLSYQIFISHSEHDRLVAEAFQTMMTTVVGRDPACFVASHSIRSGEDWFTRLNMALREASALVALLTPASLESSWVPYEVGYAHALNKKPLGLTLGLTAKQARTGPYQSIQFRSDEAKDVAEIVKDLCADYYQLMPDPNLVDEAVGTFRSSIRDHIKTSMDQHAESQQIRSAGIAGAYASWSDFVSSDFIVSQKSLWIVLKDGWSFFEKRSDVLKQRFRRAEFRTRILIVHPSFQFIKAIQLMDRDKQDQRADCLRAIRAMKAIRTELMPEIDIHRSGHVDFVGYHYVPTWTGYIGDELAYVSAYFTRPFRGKLNTLVLRRLDKNGNALPYYREMLFDAEDVLRNTAATPGFTSLFDYDEAGIASTEDEIRRR